jgi:hypothetical protein
LALASSSHGFDNDDDDELQAVMRASREEKKMHARASGGSSHGVKVGKTSSRLASLTGHVFCAHW